MKTEYSLTYKGFKLFIQRGHFYTEVKTDMGKKIARSKVTAKAIKNAKQYLDVITK